MFEVGKTYENRKGKYIVLQIKGGSLRVRYQDGTVASLQAEAQRQIISNMTKDKPSSVQEVAVVDPPTRPADTHGWERYDLWNNAIGSAFVGPNMSGRLVYFDVDDDELALLSPDDRARLRPVEDFVQSIKDTLEPLGTNLLDRHFERTVRWKKEGSTSNPPFLALLACFCLAAQKMYSDGEHKASNYYHRLAELLWGPSYTPSDKRGLQSGFRHAFRLWEELHVWLWGLAGGAGIPSAQPMSGLAHVGYPISQALLRSQDRRKLVEFFCGADLYPGQQVPPMDLEGLMNYWVPKSNLSHAAKTSWWGSPTARMRMVEVASLELGAWDGNIPDAQASDGSAPTLPVALQVRIVKGPKPRVDWGIVFRIPPQLAEVTYEVASGGTGIPAGDGDVSTSVRVTRGLDSGWSEPVDGVAIGDFLVSRVDMVEESGQTKACWQPKKVLTLTWDEELKLYRSTPRLEHDKRSLVVAFDTVAAYVRDILTPADAGEMWQLPGTWGIPSGWTVFADVRLKQLPHINDDPDLSPLEPEIWSSVEWVGGISLPGRKRWLTSRLPTVRASTLDDVNLMTIRVKGMSVNAGGEGLSFDEDGPSVEVDLADLSLDDGIYELEVTVHRKNTGPAGSTVSRQTFEICSADARLPRETLRLAHHSDNPLWPASACDHRRAPEGPSSVTVRGASVRAQHELHLDDYAMPETLGHIPLAMPEEHLVSQHQLDRTVTGVMKCFQGAHHWIIDPGLGGSDVYRPHGGICKYCGLRRVFGGYSSKLGEGPTNTGQPQQNTMVDTNVERKSIDAGTIDYDGLLEACFTLGGGSWSEFQLLARQVSEDPWFPFEEIQMLSSLGHIDVEWDSIALTPKRWAASPPVIVTTGSGDAFLAGYRSSESCLTLERLVEQHAGAFAAVSHAEGPTSYQISGLTLESLRVIADMLNKESTVQWSIIDRPSRSIAHALPALSDVAKLGREVRLPQSVELFDVQGAGWSAATIARGQGLYRSNSMPRTYCLKDQDNCMQVPYRVGKHLAGVGSGRVLLAYDARTQRLECPLGAQLPGLYERAVVLASGLPPEVDLPNRKVTYREVPNDVAQAIASRVSRQSA